MPRKIEVKNIEIDVPSFSDIAFLLIIFFILSTCLNMPMGRIIVMPSASKPDQQKSNATTPSVNILADRIMFVEGEGTGKEVTLSELRADLMSRGLASASESDRMVLLEVAPEVSYERYFQVITMISEAGGIVAMLTE